MFQYLSCDERSGHCLSSTGGALRFFEYWLCPLASLCDEPRKKLILNYVGQSVPIEVY